MDADAIAQRIAAIRARIAALHRRMRASPSEQHELSADACEELGTALLELQAAEEELCRQHEASVAARAAKEVLPTGEAHQRAILDAALDCIISMDHEGTIIEFNRSAEQTFGYRRAEVMGRKLAELIIPPSLRDRHYAGLARYLTTGEGPLVGKRVELTAMRADGSEFPIELTITCIPSEGPPTFTGFLRDITARKLAETERARLLACEQAARAEAERAADRTARLQAVTSAVSEALTPAQVTEVILDQGLPALGACAGAVVLLTDDATALSVVRAVGYSRELLDRWSRFSVDAPLPLAEAVRTGEPIFLGSPAALTERYPHLAGVQASTGTGAVAAIPLFIDGQLMGALALSFAAPRTFCEEDRAFMVALARQCAQALDRARLHEAERNAQAEAEATRRLAMLSEASAALVASLDAEDILRRLADLAVPALGDSCFFDAVTPDGRLERVAWKYADPEQAECYDAIRQFAPQQQFDGHPVSRAVRTRQSVLVPNVDGAWMERAATSHEHFAFFRRFPFQSLMTVPLIAAERVVGALTFCYMPLSGRRHGPADLALAEELARRAALAIEHARLYREAQRAVEVRDQFLALVSHELRTPLSHIKVFVTSLRQTDVEWDAETQRDFLAEIERETDRLGRQISDLLDMSRIESGGLDYSERAPAHLTAIVAAGLDRVRGLLGDRPLLVDVPADLPPAFVDAAQIERVVANLVENAAKYSPPAGTIRLSGALVDGELELRVEDEGPGIPEQYVGRLFEKFFRIHGSDTHGSERAGIPGTGLGLPICQGIVQAHGGRIWEENRPGGGACFVIRLPRAAGTTGGQP